MNAIEVTNLWKRFRLTRTHPRGGSLRDTIPMTLGRLFGRNGTPEEAFWALKDISFSVAPGEALGIIGPNGAGKSTILKLLSGILRPDRGTIRVNGRVAALIELGAGFHLDLTGRENVYLNGAIIGLKKREIDQKFDDIVEFSGIEEFIDTPIKHYSSGMAIRLGFAIAAHTDPDVLLIDEVLAVGDMAFQHRCFERIKELRCKGLPILFVSHNLHVIEAICNRVLLLCKGRKILEGEPRTVLGAYQGMQLEESSDRKKEGQSRPSSERKVIEILRVMTLDESGVPQKEFETGKPMTVRVEFRAPERVAQPVFGIAIQQCDGVYCYGTNTKLDGIDFGGVSGVGSIEITYTPLNLLPNHYRITAAAFESSGLIPYDLRQDVCIFHVKSARRDGGLFYLEHRWHLRMNGDAGHASQPKEEGVSAHAHRDCRGV